jgi:hypothetical protein
VRCLEGISTTPSKKWDKKRPTGSALEREFWLDVVAGRLLEVVLAEGDLGERLVDGGARVVQRRRLEDDAERADDARHREHPQEEPVQHHGHEFPVLDHVVFLVGVLHVLRDELHAVQRRQQLGRTLPPDHLVVAWNEQMNTLAQSSFIFGDAN